MKRKQIVTDLMAMVMIAGLGASLVACGNQVAEKEEVKEASKAQVSNTANNNYADTLTLVWYPNESAETYEKPRQEVAKLIEKATGKKVEQKLTTDYAIAIESIAGGTAQIGCCFGAEGYIQAKNSNSAVDVLFVNSGESGTLDDAMYYSYFAVKDEDADQYKEGDSYSIDNIQGKKMSFVSNSSTSGFKVPTNKILSTFGSDSKWSSLTVDDLMEGGSDAFFSEVLFGGSHQGSAFNLLSGKSEVSAFCDLELVPYVQLESGEAAQVGSVYSVISGADAPFDTIPGEAFTVISSTPVMNGPFVYNGNAISPEDVKAIQAIFTSDEATRDELLFYPEDAAETGLYKRKGENQFVLAEDSWYDPIRNMK